MEAQRLITVSLGKIASSRCQRGGINLHRNLLVASVLHKARTAYMMDAYQHIIASRKQKQEVTEESGEKEVGVVLSGGAKPEDDVCGAGRPGSAGAAMTHAAAQEISHAVQDKENSPPTIQPNSLDKGDSSSVMLGVENTSVRSENTTSEEKSQECKPTTNNAVSASSKIANCGDSTLKMSAQNRPCAVTCSTGKRRRSRNTDSSECSSESAVSPKKAKLDIPQKSEVLCGKENMENTASEILRDTTSTHEDVSSINDSGVTCKVTKSCDRSEPMQTESTQITSLVTIFNSGFSGLCSRNTTSDTNSSAQSQPLSCATELKHESVQIPSVIALTV
ncbi:immediate early response gene 2 protein-like [Liolophura sinensis]|uniref:immediate early response gene 2 protein-like n=1 Tax=Liolophura sinensis TaxID=3198878 RepID=UPI003159429A